ncbi:MAG: hypothetical protein H7829_03520 [Magnetococcus sp. THC-1_WYH]
MNPSDMFRIAATAVEGFSQIKKARADGVVTAQEMLDAALALAEKSGLDTLILARAKNAPILDILAELVNAAHDVAVEGGEVTFSDMLRIAKSLVAEAGMSDISISRVH